MLVYGMSNVSWETWNAGRGKLNVLYGTCDVECRMRNVQCGMLDVECGMWNVKYG